MPHGLYSRQYFYGIILKYAFPIKFKVNMTSQRKAQKVKKTLAHSIFLDEKIHRHRSHEKSGHSCVFITEMKRSSNSSRESANRRDKLRRISLPGAARNSHSATEKHPVSQKRALDCCRVALKHCVYVDYDYFMIMHAHLQARRLYEINNFQVSSTTGSYDI
jgi:hypothetical protein